MQILDSPELIKSMDIYELLLASYPEVIPVVGFTVLQTRISLERISTRAALGATDLIKPPTGETYGVVSLRKIIPSLPLPEYQLSLLCRSEKHYEESEEERGEREECFRSKVRAEHLVISSFTRFTRNGSAIRTRTYQRDNQGQTDEFIPPEKRLLQIHCALAQSILISDQAHQEVIDTQATLDERTAQSKDENRTPAQRKSLTNSLKHIKLR